MFAAILLPNILARGNTRQYGRYNESNLRRTGCSKNVSGNIEQQERNGSLKAVFNLGKTVTSGNASQISDGASAMVVCDEKSVKPNSGPIVLITGYSYVANEPGLLFDAPYKAVENLLQKTDGTISDFDLIEINEAFSAQVLANEKKIGWDRDVVNIHGGAIALGHPVGASGARIITTLIHALSLNKLKQGLAIICHGGGGAAAMSLELV